ncbi:nonribosomal peptide synthase [Aspergillus piperis CBS 112811]|uniref:Nonribosomal peptide synthase n=1 Tax=Aspergillus piperis CBS 112811 TaxID=1448313 RepID=A0A8G1R6K4_9EURO|nr:nonribosomal peptide synthase [Aspergillus piperis CBS 112811]RAH57715.1 nonribosomal peptide synthase [Aspergillus piperis CBS 112811]
MANQGEIGGNFPSLNDGVEAECTVRVQDVLTLPVTEIEKFCRDTGTAIPLFIKTVWLIVMWPFLEIDRICIGYRDYRDSPPHRASGPEKVIQSGILPDISVMKLLESDIGTESGNLCDECPPAHNTAIALIREISESDRSELLIEAEKWNYSIALVGEVDEVSALVRLSLVHKSSTLSPCLAENISSTVLQVIQEILADSHRRIMDLSLFSSSNRDHVLRWNRKDNRGPAVSLIEQVHQHACERPHHPVICAWDGVLSYSEFDSLTTRWASYLQGLGIGPQCMVPMMMTNSQWMTVAEIAIMKAGGTYVPLDSTQPFKRLEDIITQVNATFGISSPDLEPVLSSLVGVVVTLSATTTLRLPPVKADFKWPDITPDTKAYVLFTSGSTGRPKGCVVCHGALGNSKYHSQALRITAQSRVLQFASHGFAVSLLEVHCSLAVGATICIPSKEDRLNGLNSAMDSMRVSWAVLTPSAALSLATPLESLKTLALIGEPMRNDLFRKLADEVEVILVYGSTEWVGLCASHPIRSQIDIKCIGPSPTGNLWLVDPTDHNRLAPVGAVGEVLIESPGLAQGYLNNDSQTAANFVDAPAWLQMIGSGAYPGARFYKTTDLAQFYADGKIRYVGRKSTQVKIRGKRLDLGEIEYQIQQISPSIEKVIAEVASPKGSETPIVVAFLYSQDQEALLLHFHASVDAIKESLEKTLPDHMWPSIYVPLESVPLTRTGKTDRKALRHIISASSRQDLQNDQIPASPTVAPVTELEIKLHQLFAETMHIDPSSFGINHSVIQLGGDSITAMGLANRFRQMNYRLTMQDILEQQTVAKLASQLDGYNRNNASPTTSVGEEQFIKQSSQPASESVLCEDFINVLGINISSTDRFIDHLDSTTGAKFVDHVNRRLGINVTVQEVFQFPTIATLAKWLQSQCKGPSPISKTPYNGPVVQSFAQGRLWFLDQLHPGSTWYVLPFATRLRGQINLSALEAALNAIVERHEPLRTTFKGHDGIGVQVVHPFQPKGIKIIDMAISNNQNIWDALRKEQRTAFNLEVEAGWRPLVFRLRPDDHILSVVMHHIISDGWSLDLLQKELDIFYSAAIRGLPLFSQIDPLPTNYRDFSVWQRQQEDKDQSQVDYWVGELEGSKPAELLCDKPRPSILSGDAGLQTVDIRGALYRKLQLFCKAHRVTAYTVLLAAFRATQYRLTGAEDVTIGTPFAGRHHQELEPLIGFFVNLQCIRTKVEHADTTFYHLVRQIQKKSSMAFNNQDVPFEKLVSRLTEERDLSRNPLVQMVFAVHSQYDLGKLAIEGVEAQRVTLSSASRFDLECHFYQAEDSFRGEILFSLDLFYPETINMLHLAFIDILEHGLTRPTTPIDLMPFTDAKSSLEKNGLLEIHKTDYPRESSIVDVFQRRVRCCPSKVAVKDCSTQLTYHELDLESDRVALFLTDRSLAPETVIGVLADRGCEVIIAFLGILKANLVYLPLDVKYPVSRLETILSSTQSCELVLRGSHIEPPSMSLSNLHFISISDIFATMTQPEKPSPHAARTSMPRADSAAYVVYTSGSTGIPKGVIMPHKAIVRLTQCTSIISPDSAAGNIAHMSNLAFDMSVWEIYTALLNGGTLVCIDPMTVLDYRSLAQTFVRERIQVAMITPAMLKQCLIESPSIISQLDILFAAGDRLDPLDAMKARALVRRELINAYGPTENGVLSTTYSVTDKEVYPHRVPIGAPVSNSGAYVMDPRNQLVPVGIMGELVVTGDGLAKGYIDSRLDADRFVMLDLPGQPSMRAYRTGDLARYRPTDGQLEYLGRMDHQVKIRGHRVELDEIDQSMLAYGFIKHAVTIIRQEKAADSELVSFITLREGEDLHLAGDLEIQDGAQKVNAWEDLFDTSIYGLSRLRSSNLGRDFVGWKSMYTGELIENAEMNEWLDDTVGALLNGGSAGHVFEVGTGTGMILFNIIAGLESYTALEPSGTAVDFVQASVTTIPGLQGKVRLQKGIADNITQLDRSGSVDVAVINSVAQYFPSTDYLLKVIEDLVCLQGAKRIFLGDVRSYALYEEFQVSKALANSTPRLPTIDDIRSQMAETVHLEEELLIHPAFFTSLPSRFPKLIEHVEILPKRMVATNELSCYRYAAVLHTKHQQAQPRNIHDVEERQWLDFIAQKMNHASLLEYLQEQTNDTSVVAISNIPYRKTLLERLIVDLLRGRLAQRVGGPGWVESLNEMAKRIPSLSPLDLMRLGKQSGFHVEISWARQHTQRGGLDAIFHRIQPDRTGSRVLFRFPTDHYGRSVRQLSNNPLQQASNRDIGKWVRKTLEKTLPPYMVPRMVRVLEQIPVNSNGKVDRRALANMVTVSAFHNTMTARADPQDDVERALLARFTKVLGKDIGISESFFDHGGHSLTAIKLVNGINQDLHTSLTVGDIFECPTVTGLAAKIRARADLHEGVNFRNMTPDSAPFSLIGGSISSNVSRELVKMGLSATDVMDIVPATDVQSWMLAGWTPVSISFDIHGSINVGDLRTACLAVAQRHSILRTAFTKLEGKDVQVVLRATDIPFTHKPIAGGCSDETHSGPSPMFSKLPTKFELVSRSPRDHSFSIWLSHAQYDGYSLPLLFADMRSAYNDRLPSLPIAAPFADYIYGCARLRSPDSLGFWKNYLQGARLTTLPNTTLRGDETAADVKATVTGDLPTPLPGIPLSMLINAAYAFILADTINTPDITFMLGLNNRDLPITGVEGILGPCINRSLIRVQWQQGWTVRELCQSVHDNYTAISRYGFIELPDIIANCTDWPVGTEFGCGINHFPALSKPSFSFNDAEVSNFSMTGQVDMTNHLYVRSFVGEETWQLQVLTSSNMMNPEDASVLASRILDIGHKFSQYPETSLSSLVLR